MLVNTFVFTENMFRTLEVYLQFWVPNKLIIHRCQLRGQHFINISCLKLRKTIVVGKKPKIFFHQKIRKNNGCRVFFNIESFNININFYRFLIGIKYTQKSVLNFKEVLTHLVLHTEVIIFYKWIFWHIVKHLW